MMYAATLSVLLLTTTVFMMYGLGGRIAHQASRQWRFWQPFLGGAKFVFLQALSWTFFTVSLLLEVGFIISTFALGFELFVGAAVVAGVFFLASEALMILSLSFFIPTESTEGSKMHVTFMPVTVDKDSLERFRCLTVITILSNMQYLPFLLPILPFLLSGLSFSVSGQHWFYFFCCLTAGVVVNAYVKQMLAKQTRIKPAHARLAEVLPLLAYTLPAVCCYLFWRTPAWPAWVFLTGVYYLYVLLTFRGTPEVTGHRYLGKELRLGSFSLYSFLDGIEKYFEGKLISDGKLDPKQPYLFAFHPHGVQPFTVMWIQLSRQWREHEAFRDMRFSVMTASVMHYVPLMRDILQWMGGREVSRQSIERALRTKESILLVPGGQSEMMVSQSNVGRIRIVTYHTGFIKIALQNGVPLVPVLSFGEMEVMDFVRLPLCQEFFISRIGIPVPFFPYGLVGFPIPRPVPVTVVFGKPLPVKKIADPSPADIQAVADKYFKRIREIFDRYKVQAGCPEHELELLDRNQRHLLVDVAKRRAECSVQ
jgi:diacylglycerol O-acyltransferase 2, plant